jgi:hypothetical protein
MSKRQFRPTVDGVQLEDRLVLSTVSIAQRAPVAVLTTHTYYQVLVGIDNAFRSWAHSNGGNAAFLRLEHDLAVQAVRVPFGNANLVPQIPGSLANLTLGNANLVRNQVKFGLRSYIQQGLGTGSFIFLQSNDHHSSDKDFPRNGHV